MLQSKREETVHRNNYDSKESVISAEKTSQKAMRNLRNEQSLSAFRGGGGAYVVGKVKECGHWIKD